MLVTENWCLKVEDKVYGPYTTEQMRKFAHQGRLAAWSMIAPAGGRAWREARMENIFSNFFGDQSQKPLKSTERTFGKKSDWQDAAEGSSAGLDSSKTRDVRSKATKRFDGSESGAPHIANFIVIFDVVSASATRVEAAVMSLGHAFRVADNVWSVTCELTAVGVRNAIAPYLRNSESIFVVDATRGRTSWRNYAPEIQAKISAAYLRSKVA